jgi:hypothetical protein
VAINFTFIVVYFESRTKEKKKEEGSQRKELKKEKEIKKQDQTKRQKTKKE